MRFRVTALFFVGKQCLSALSGPQKPKARSERAHFLNRLVCLSLATYEEGKYAFRCVRATINKLLF